MRLSSLGNNLHILSSLTHLDVSRNNITSLSGLDGLLTLESLNLYYNKIDDMRQILLLQLHSSLRALDMRLNPVCRQEGYRSFVIYTLPWITKLDEREVREEERQMAVREVSLMEQVKHSI